MKSPVQLFTAVAILLATATVAAQVYKWVDKDGKIQYSDTPPPATESCGGRTFPAWHTRAPSSGTTCCL